MKVLFTICGRAGSKGIKNKNIRNFVGKPLPYYTVSIIDLFLKNTKLDIDYDIVLNTDSPELIGIMKRNCMRAVDVIERSAELAGDAIGKIDVIHDCLIKMVERTGKIYDVVVDLDITSPLRTASDLDKLISRHTEKNADVTTSVTSARRNPFFNQLKKTEHGFKKVIDSDYTARQQAPKIYDMNASLYAYSPEFLKSGKGVLSGYCECIEMYDTGILDLDDENDFELMEVIAVYLYKNKKEYEEGYKNICFLDD